MLDADLGQGAEPIDRLGRSLAPEVDRLQVRPLDLPERPAYFGAAFAQDRELVGQLIRAAEDIAGVRVFGHQAQRLLFAAAADEDLRVWLADRLWRVQQPRRLVVLALECGLRPVLPLPHLVADAERFLQHLETDPQGRHREAQAVAFFFVPGGADAEVGASAAQNVQRRCGLGPQAGLAVVDAAHHQPQRRLLRMGRHVAQGSPAFEHRLLGLPDAADLVEVVHHPQRGEAGRVGCLGDASESRADGRIAARPCERGNLQTDLHSEPPGANRGSRRPSRRRLW